MSNGKHRTGLVLQKTVIWPDSSEYPINIRSKIKPPPVLTVLGNIPDNLPPSLALLSSTQTPASVLLAIHDLAQQWRLGPQIIVSGFQSPVEQEAFTVLLRGPGRIVYCPARGLPQRLKQAWQTPLAEGRLTIVSPFAETVRRGTKETAIYRNRFVAALADAVLVAYAHPGSSTEQLAREALAWGKRVYTLDHPANEGLLAMGAAWLAA